MSRVKLSSISALTFYKDSVTQYRRTSPIPQLTCVGKACSFYTPDVVRCENVGGDGAEIDWKCEADLPEALRFGRVEVSCEGWSAPGDPYVLKGSCGLEYRLNEIPKFYQSQDPRKPRSSDLGATVFTILWGAVLIFIAYSFLKSCLTTTNNRTPRSTSGSSNPRGPQPGSSFPGFFGGEDRSEPPPPPYSKTPGTNEPWWRPGFWSGAALGGLGTALWNNRQQSSRLSDRTRWDWERPFYQEPMATRRRPTAVFEDRGEGSSSMGSMRRSTGLGGTNVR